MRGAGCLLLVLGPLLLLPPSAGVVVSTSQQLVAALTDPEVADIVVDGSVVLGTRAAAAAPPITVARALTISGASPTSSLSFSSDTGDLIRLGAGGQLLVRDILITEFHPEEAVVRASESGDTVVAALVLAQRGASAYFLRITFHVNHSYERLAEEMPFWAATLLVTARIPPRPSGASAAGGQDVWDVSSATAAGQAVWDVSNYTARVYGGSSTATVEDSVLVLDPAGCFTNSGEAIAYDSNSLLAGLLPAQAAGPLPAGANATAASSQGVRVLLFQNTTMDMRSFSLLANLTLRSGAALSACTPTTLDLNGLQHAITLASGSALTFGGNMTITGGGERGRSGGGSGVVAVAGMSVQGVWVMPARW